MSLKRFLKSCKKHLEKAQAKRRRRLFQSIIPTENQDVASRETSKGSPIHTSRPGFSLPLMTNNFRRFNAR